jgi:signal recognition particle subunit SRP54
MLDVLTRGFRNARLKLQGRATLTEENVADALKDVRISLLEADVSLDVVQRFLDQVKTRALGTVVKTKVKGSPFEAGPADHFVKACYDELEELMGSAAPPLDLSGKPATIMMVGLQGSGKTTTAGKLARMLQKQGRKPMLVAADIYRPAAVDQLQTLGRKLAIPVFSIKGMNPVQLCTLAVTQARNVGRDVVIFDTAGRLAIDEPLMVELEQIQAKAGVANTLFVCDAMIGQDAVRTAAEFDRRLSFSGFVLTKLDGDARGGAALSIKSITGKPIQFLGMGEGLDKLEEFRGSGLASRILGMGDVVGLMKDFEQVVDRDTAEKDAERMLQGSFTFDDFQNQLKMIRSMGPLREVLGKLPFMDEIMGQIPAEALDDYEMVKVESMIQSMTRQERRKPEVLNDSRMRRIAGGSGRTLTEVQDLRSRFFETRKMMKQMGSMMGGPAGLGALAGRMGGGGFPGLGGMPGMPGMPAPGRMRELTAAEKDARKKKAKEARKARKRQRR